MMEVRILNKEPLFDYRQACKTTQGIKLDDKKWKPKNETEFWIKHILANHSTLRSIRFRVIDDTSKSVIMQIIRATKGHPQPEVESSRPDWTGKERSNNPYEDKLFMQDHTAESFIEMAKQRLCNRTEKRTREYMMNLVLFLRGSEEPFLKALGYCCRPACEYNGCACIELESCGKYPKLSDSIIERMYRIEGK